MAQMYWMGRLDELKRVEKGMEEIVTKDDAQNLIECVNDLIRLIPKSKKMEGLGAANELFLYLEKAKREAKA